MRDELKEGDQLLVKVIGIDGQKVKLSRKGRATGTTGKVVLKQVPPAPGDPHGSRWSQAASGG